MKILVATDLSARSDRALQRAVALAHARASEVEVLHVIDDSFPEAIIDQLEQIAENTIRDQISALNLHREGECSTTIVRGRDYADIIKRAETVGADLIILGITRQTTREMFRGTTAERVIRYGHVPVLVVRDPVVRSYQRVLLGVDLSVHSRRALQFAAELVPKGEFFLVHATHEPFRGFLGSDTLSDLVRDEQKEFKLMIGGDISEMTERLRAAAPRFEIIFGLGMAEAVIRDQIAQLKPDLVVIGTHGRTGVAHAMLGSVAEDLLADVPVDILAVKTW
jgi:nucleotide-binding universal stress UspA family protein